MLSHRPPGSCGLQQGGKRFRRCLSGQLATQLLLRSTAQHSPSSVHESITHHRVRVSCLSVCLRFAVCGLRCSWLPPPWFAPSHMIARRRRPKRFFGGVLFLLLLLFLLLFLFFFFMWPPISHQTLIMNLMNH